MQQNIKKSTIFHTSKKNINWNGLTLTNTAVCQILKLINKDSTMLGLKINIKKSGCAGFSYSISKATTLDQQYLIYERNGAKLFISPEIMSLIDGAELDYIQDGLNHMFKFNNPQIQLFCGCGESFSI